MKRKVVCILFLCMLSASVFPSSILLGIVNSTNSGAQTGVDWWTMFHHDLTHTGYSTSTAPTTNRTLWTYNTSGDVNDPAVVNGILYVGSYDDKIYALNAKNGAFIWSFTTGGYMDTSPTVANGVVYATSNDNKTYALNAKNGALIWSFATQGRIDSSPAVAEGKVFTCSADRHIYALNATNGVPLWNYSMSRNAFLSSPAVSGNLLFVGTYRRVYALNTANGASVWNFTSLGGFNSSPAVAYGLVFVGSSNKNVYALNESTGAVEWNYLTGGYVDSGPAVSNGMVFVGSEDHNVYALSAYSGNFIWKFVTGDIVVSSPAVAGGIVFVGSLDHKVYALNAVDGDIVWSYATGGFVVSSPAVVNGVVYLGSWDHSVYAFGTITSSNALLLDFIVALLVAAGTVVSATLLFVRRRKVGRDKLVDSPVQKTLLEKKGVSITKFEVAADVVRLFASEGFLKKRLIAVKEFPVYEITNIDSHENMLMVTWKGTEYTFFMNKEAGSLGELRDSVIRMIENRRIQLEKKEKAAIRKKALFELTNASMKIVDFSFDILISLSEKRIDWRRLERYSNDLAESVRNLDFTAQPLPPLNTDFSKIFTNIQMHKPKDISLETYHILEKVHDYFDGLRFDEDAKNSSLDTAKSLVLGYFLLNDLFLGMIVGDDKNGEEKAQLETVLQHLDKKSNAKSDLEELRHEMSNNFGNIERILEKNRRRFKEQLNRLSRAAANGADF